MNRDIRFRGVSIVSEEMVYGSYLRFESDHYIVTCESVCVDKETNSYENQPVYVIVKPETVGQFCGLKDCNGRDIYEGDTVKIRDTYNECWSTECAEIVFTHEYAGGWVASKDGVSCNIGTRTMNIDVIGTIHTK